MSRSPQAISSAAVRRHLEAAGPTVAQVLAAITTEGAPPAGIQPLVDHVEQTKRWALESGSRQAAWLLYMAARSCLAQIPEYARETEFSGLPAGRPAEFTGRFRRLSSRLSGLSSPPALADHIIALAPRDLARECLTLAGSIDGDWSWLELQRALLEQAQGDASGCQERLVALGSQRLEEALAVEVHRNILSCALRLGNLDSHAESVSEFRRLDQSDRLGIVFEACLAAGRADVTAFWDSIEAARERPDQRGTEFWHSFLELNAVDWAQAIGMDAGPFVEKLRSALQ